MSEEQTRVFRAYDPEKQFEMLEEASDELAKAVYKEFLVEKNEKILLSKLISEHLLGGNISSVAKAEHAARCSKEYLTHIKGLAIAKKALCRAKARYENLRGLAEARRTQESSARYMRGDTVG